MLYNQKKRWKPYFLQNGTFNQLTDQESLCLNDRAVKICVTVHSRQGQRNHYIIQKTAFLKDEKMYCLSVDKEENGSGWKSENIGLSWTIEQLLLVNELKDLQIKQHTVFVSFVSSLKADKQMVRTI